MRFALALACIALLAAPALAQNNKPDAKASAAIQDCVKTKGTMATPMSADCVNRETAQRALFLLGFLNDTDGK